MTSCRPIIIETYAAWTALSALRSGSPIKSRKDIYPLLKTVSFASVLDGSVPIDEAEFSEWHHAMTLHLCKQEPRLCIGWAVKLLNVYLKTAGYVGGLGRPGLPTVLHPPIDAGLWRGLDQRFADRPELLVRTHAVTRIKDIRDYDTYLEILAGCREAAVILRCHLIEVEQLWDQNGVVNRRRNPW